MRAMVGDAEEALNDRRHAFAGPHVPEKSERLRAMREEGFQFAALVQR